MEMERRDFLKMAAGVVPFAFMNPQLFANPEGNGNWDNVLVLVELRGGNDGLNTIVPFGDKLYYSYRPRIAIPRKNVIKINNQLGFNPVLKPLMDSWNSKEMAVVAGVGYPRPNRSHFRSIEIWETASDSDEFLTDGWISNIFATDQPSKKYPADALILDRGQEGPLSGSNMRNIVMTNPERFFKEALRLKKLSKTSKNEALNHLLGVQKDLLKTAELLHKKLQSAPTLRVKFPRNRLGRQMEIAARLLSVTTPAPVIKVSMGSFDTHSNQKNSHIRLLTELSQSIAAFRSAMKQVGKWNKTMVMTYSEFGRRVKENGSQGTDHGTAAPHFVLGGKVKGGLYGKQPGLDNLQRGDLRHTIDYRSMYSTVSQNWWKVDKKIHNQNFPKISFL